VQWGQSTLQAYDDALWDIEAKLMSDKELEPENNPKHATTRQKCMAWKTA
jgi:hypothetical protein